MTIAPTTAIFDLDGVLVDTAVYHFQAWKRLANQLGFDFSEEQNEQLKGVSRMHSLELVLGWGNVSKNETEKLALATLKNDWYVAMINRMTPAEVLPGARELLIDLRKKGVLIALGSASRNAALILDRTELGELLDVVVDGNSVSRSKPDPQVFLKAAALLGASPSSCVVFEDALAGIQAAKSAGMFAIAVGDRHKLPGADHYVTGLNELTVAGFQQLAESGPERL